jgi:arylsulfatase
MACITEAAIGFPNASGTIPPENGMLSEILGELGWNTYMVGKWHLCPDDEMNLAATRRNWPTGRGFERWYGFLGAETNQWYPDLVYDNHPVEQPASPEEGYHFGTDITDKALQFIRDAKAIAPDKPFFLYYCPGAAHAPHHVPREWADRYKGTFDMGYEAYRELVFARQKERGIVADGAELSPINPYAGERSADGEGWPELDTVRPWDSLRDDEKRLFSRLAEVYAGFLSHADNEIGRLLDHLEASGELDNTLIVVVSDNGASGEGGPNGSVNENKIFNGLPDTIEDALPFIDELGGPRTYNHYPTGWAWAFNAPFKMWKRYSNFEGGTADPMIVSWPGRLAATGVCRQYAHAIDIVPTIYEALGVELPEAVKGYTQHELEGVSFAATFGDPAATTAKQTSSTRCSAPGRSGTRAGRPLRSRRRRPTAGRDSRPSAGSSTTPRATRASATTSPPSSPRSCRSSSTSGGPRPGATTHFRWSRGTRSRSSARNGRSSPSPRRATPTTRAAPRSRSPSRRTSATARSRLRSR